MAQKFNPYTGGSQSPTQNIPPINGFSDLMSTLMSPGLPTPSEGSFNSAWPGSQLWQNAKPNNFGFGMPYQGQGTHQPGPPQSSGHDYVAFENDNENDDDLFTVDDTDMFPNGSHNILPRRNQSASEAQNARAQLNEQSISPLTSISRAPQPASESKLQNIIASGTPAVTRSPTTNDKTRHAERAAELRAQLLLAKKKGTPPTQSSPATKSTTLATTPKPKDQEPPNQVIEKTAAKTLVENSINNNATIKSQGAASEAGINHDLESLFAEARTVADGNNRQIVPSDQDHIADAQKNKDQPGSVLAAGKPDTATKPESRPALKKRPSSPELSEGEICGDSDSGKPSSSKEPSEPAKLKEAREVTREHAEKQRRQSQVYLTYQPLKDPSHKAEQATVRKMSDTSSSKHIISPKSATGFESRARPWSSNGKERGEYDSYKPSRDARRDHDRDRERVGDMHRRNDDRERPPPNSHTSAKEPKRSGPNIRQELEARSKKLVDENAREAALYKKSLEAKEAREAREEASRARGFQEIGAQQDAISRQPQTMDTKTDAREERPGAPINERPNIPSIEQAMTEAPVNDEVQTDPLLAERLGVSSNGQSFSSEDINDWLELTEFYDEEYRIGRLARLRKKRRLEAERAELEREEQMELEQRSNLLRSQPTIPSSISPKVIRQASLVKAENVKMAPPPLPLRQANKDAGIKIKDVALSAGSSQPPTPNLKRQHVQDDTEAPRLQRQEKVARVDLNGYANHTAPTSPTLVKDDSLFVRGGQLPLEKRITRENDLVSSRYRPRSISPVYRRRSMSPRRRYSGDYAGEGPRNPNDLLPEQPYYRTCRICDEEGHYQRDCPRSRRDGQDRFQGGYQNHGISPNYRGRFPTRGGGYRSPYSRGGGHGGRTRHGSLAPEGEIENGPRRPIGSAGLSLGAGGQSRQA